MEDAQLPKRRLRKLDPRVHVGYLAGYYSTNILIRVWIPRQGKVNFTRDVLFDEDTFFDGRKTRLLVERIAQMDELVGCSTH
jgi:hypothetical protein